MQNKSPSFEGLPCARFTHDLYISAQGLDKRFTKESTNFVHCVLEKALSKRIKSISVNTKIINLCSVYC